MYIIMYIKFSSYLTGNTSHLHYKDQPVNAVWRKKNAVYCENHMKHINTLCGQNGLQRVDILLLQVYMVTVLALAAVSIAEDLPQKQQDKRGIAAGFSTNEQDVGIAAYDHAVPISQTVEVTNSVPVPVLKYIQVPHPVPVAIPVPQPVPVHIKVPHPVLIPVVKTVAVPVEKPIAVPVPVERPVPYPVEKPHPVYIEKHVPVPVPKPYPVHVPVYKHIRYYPKIHYRHGW
jgi:hypothetical protein